MYNIIYETSRQYRFDAQYWMLGAGALGRLRGMVWGGRREEGSGWGTRVCLWRIHFNIWQNQYNIVKFKNKIKLKIKEKKKTFASWKESYDKSIQNIKKQRHHFANKCPYSESYVFSSSHVRVVNGCKIWAIKKAEG